MSTALRGAATQTSERRDLGTTAPQKGHKARPAHNQSVTTHRSPRLVEDGDSALLRRVHAREVLMVTREATYAQVLARQTTRVRNLPRSHSGVPTGSLSTTGAATSSPARSHAPSQEEPS
jgi:hypothetical protein